MYIAECYDQLVQFEVQLTVIEYSVTERKSLNVPLHQKTGGRSVKIGRDCKLLLAKVLQKEVICHCLLKQPI